MKILVINHQADCSAERFQPWLEAAGFQIDNRLGPAGQLPNHIHYSTNSPASDHFCAVIITGGDANVGDPPHSVWWFPQVEQLIRESLTQDIPVLGICLGAQLVAHALGGQIDSCNNQLKTCAKPYEFGLTDIYLNRAGLGDPLFASLSRDLIMHENHQAHIAKLPDGAELLASSELCPVEAFRCGCYIYGTQFHPEVSADTINDWKPETINRLTEAGINWQAIVERSHRDANANLTASQQLCRNFINIIWRRAES